MSEPPFERLSRFTPDAGRLDRDALLFAAGQCSVGPNRRWMTLAALLAGTQTLSLVLLWPHPTPPTGGFTSPIASVPAPPVTLDHPPSEAPVNAGLWSARHGLRGSETEDRRAGNATLIDCRPPLRAFPLPRRS